MDIEVFVEEMKMIQRFFNKSTSQLVEKDATFKPNEEMYTVIEHISHTAHTLDWFLEGAFAKEGFDMNFEDQFKALTKYDSLEKAKNFFNEAVERFVSALREKGLEAWAVPIADKDIMTGLPRFAVVSAINDHTAHHRGALTVYARLCGHTPEMPY